jgi:cyclic-di-GMP-binding biofilm dispersal mediator protein
MAKIELSGARVLVLGGSGELGSRIAAELRRRGATVLLAGRDADRLKSRAAVLGPDVRSVIFDLRRPSHAGLVVDTAVRFLGGLDGVVNAAGVVAFGSLADLDDDVLDELLAVDLAGPLRVMRAALPHLSGGFFVNISGVVAEAPMAGVAAYSAVKAGLSAAGRALARELRRSGIHVLDARPPHTETGLASRPIGGTAPAMKPGLEPDVVAAAIVAGLAEGRRELPGDAFLDTGS